jgi:hypothetical protein
MPSLLVIDRNKTLSIQVIIYLPNKKGRGKIASYSVLFSVIGFANGHLALNSGISTPVVLVQHVSNTLLSGYNE